MEEGGDFYFYLKTSDFWLTKCFEREKEREKERDEKEINQLKVLLTAAY